MLSVRPAQLAALRQAVRRRLARELARHLRAHHPGEVSLLDDATLVDGIECLILRAEAYGMTLTASVALFVVAAFVSHPRFDEHPLVRRYLHDAAVAPDTRIRVALANISDAQWSTIIAELCASHDR